MNIERLLEIALEADKIGDYVTADRVTNLLKTAQGGAYSVYPNQAAYSRTQQQSQQMLQAQQNLSKPTTQQMPAMPQMNQQMPAMPQMNQQMPAMPQMNQQMPQQYGIYYAPRAAGATYFTPGVVNVAQPQMTEKQKAFADLRGTGIYNSLARSRGVMDQRLQAQAEAEKKAKQSRINYGPAATPRFLEGTNTQAEYVPNPNAPINPKLYGSGYASMAMAPQQPMLQQPQAQQSYQNLNNYSYNQNYNTPANQNYYNNAMMQQQQQQNFPLANHSGDFYFESDNGGPIDQSMNVAFGTQNNSAKYRDGNPNMSPTR